MTPAILHYLSSHEAQLTHSFWMIWALRVSLSGSRSQVTICPSRLLWRALGKEEDTSEAAYAHHTWCALATQDLSVTSHVLSPR